MRGTRGKNGKQASFLATRRLDLWGSAVRSTTAPGFVSRASTCFPLVVISPRPFFPSFTALFLVLADNLSFCKPPRMNFLQSSARFIVYRSFSGGGGGGILVEKEIYEHLFPRFFFF